MNFQEILDGITQHRANPINLFDAPPNTDARVEIQRKVDEIEWALQALAERLRDITRPSLSPEHNPVLPSDRA